MGTSELSGKPRDNTNTMGNLGMDWHPIQEREGEVQILLVASRHKNLPAELATCLKYRLNLLPQTIYCIS